MKNLLKYIYLLQTNSNNNCDCLNNNYNTRVIEIYKRNGEIFSSNNYNYYRVMKVNENCCTLLLLSLDNNTYTSTNEYITISTNCIGAIRCIEDIVLSNL